MSNATPLRLPNFALFAAMLASAGLPIYIHAPKFYVDEYGVSLAALGAVLFGLRLFDFVQDPALGWLADRTGAHRGAAVAGAAVLLAISMVGLFALGPMLPPLLWFGITLTGLFTAFSFLTICFYAEGVDKAERMGPNGHVRLASWRESGALLGVCVAAAVPTVLALGTGSPFTLFAAGFAGLVLLAVFGMRMEWQSSRKSENTGFRGILADGVSRRLLLIALLNATPVAVTSTLFLFFVESRLLAPGWEGPLLILFFLSAAAAAPVWGRVAERIGAKSALLAGMVLAIASFAFAAMLGAGDTIAFAIICIASGAALGADMTLLPAIFSRRMSETDSDVGQAFGLWSFVSKFTLALAAITLLPLLDASGFQSGADNGPQALTTLTILYALLPCALKLIALGLLVMTPLKES